MLMTSAAARSNAPSFFIVKLLLLFLLNLFSRTQILHFTMRYVMQYQAFRFLFLIPVRF